MAADVDRETTPSRSVSESVLPAANHRFPASQFDALAAGCGDEGTVSLLLAGERSRRLLLLRTVLAAARAQPQATDRWPSAEIAWSLLARAQGRAPAEVDRLLLHPPVGMWAAHALRTLRGSASDEAPMWVHLGHLNAVAAVAAIRAGLDFAVPVPVRHGDALLPTLGRARLPARSPWDVADVCSEAGSVRVSCGGATVRMPDESGVDGPAWDSHRELRVEASGRVLEVSLDDLDPYRGLHGLMPPDRLGPEAVGRWWSMLDRAWTSLTRDHPQQADELASGLLSLVPSPAAGRFRPHSASAGDSFGSAVVSAPDDATQLAVTLVHEFQHTKLNGLLHLVTLHEDTGRAQLYAPWRDDPRPLGGLLHGVYAFFGVAEFWRRRRQLDAGAAGDLAHFEFALWRQQLRTGLETLRSAPGLTDLGRRFVGGLATRLEPWLDEPVPPAAEAAAETAVADHSAAWRAHHLRPGETAVREAANAWLAGRPAPAGALDLGSTVEPDPAARWLDTRAVLTRLLLADPAGFDDLRMAPSTVDHCVLGATPADVACVAGDLETARRLYIEELTGSPDRAMAWPGLGLALRPDGPSPASVALLRRPELVREVARAVAAATGRPAQPVELAEWLAAGGSRSSRTSSAPAAESVGSNPSAKP
jgi:HEXXH motif-containing protein